jgi:hypothetical protein
VHVDCNKYAASFKITNGVKKEDLTGDDCAPDELIDSAMGLWAIMCATRRSPSARTTAVRSEVLLAVRVGAVAVMAVRDRFE